MIRTLLVLLSIAGCGKPEQVVTPPRIIDISSSFEPLRRDFDMHHGEARFLTLLSPS